MTSSVFVDANVFLRHLLHDVPDQAARATSFVDKVERKEILAETSASVLAEVIFVLERTHKRSKSAIRDALVELISLPGLAVMDGHVVLSALDVYVDLNISYTDAFIAVQMNRRGISEIVSFDRDFDRILGIRRVEP